MMEYQPDFPQLRWMEQAASFKSSHKVLLSRLSGSAPGVENREGHMMEIPNICMVHCLAAFGNSGSHLFLRGS